jgi:DNA recombination protein RmuC
MFIPHESIYYDLLVSEVGAIKVNTQDLISYAFNKKVIMVSPTSFLAYLQTVLHGLRALHIEKEAQEIRKNVEELGRHLKSYEEFHGKLGVSLGTVINHYTATNKEFKKIEKDVLRITGDKLGIETVEVTKPVLE